jgi:DedD protein
LVLFAVVFLPMVFDPEPKSTLPPVSVRIPGENETPFAPKLPAKPSTGAEYVIQVGAFTRPDPVLAKLAGAKLPYYTEPAQGNLVRVRAGPFASREAADQALAKLKELGLKPGAISAK